MCNCCFLLAPRHQQILVLQLACFLLTLHCAGYNVQLLFPACSPPSAGIATATDAARALGVPTCRVAKSLALVLGSRSMHQQISPQEQSCGSASPLPPVRSEAVQQATLGPQLQQAEPHGSTPLLPYQYYQQKHLSSSGGISCVPTPAPAPPHPFQHPRTGSSDDTTTANASAAFYPHSSSLQGEEGETNQPHTRSSTPSRSVASDATRQLPSEQFLLTVLRGDQRLDIQKASSAEIVALNGLFVREAGAGGVAGTQSVWAGLAALSVCVVSSKSRAALQLLKAAVGSMAMVRYCGFLNASASIAAPRRQVGTPQRGTNGHRARLVARPATAHSFSSSDISSSRNKCNLSTSLAVLPTAAPCATSSSAALGLCFPSLYRHLRPQRQSVPLYLPHSQSHTYTPVSIHSNRPPRTHIPAPQKAAAVTGSVGDGWKALFVMGIQAKVWG